MLRGGELTAPAAARPRTDLGLSIIEGFADALCGVEEELVGATREAWQSFVSKATEEDEREREEDEPIDVKVESDTEPLASPAAPLYTAAEGSDAAEAPSTADAGAEKTQRRIERLAELKEDFERGRLADHATYCQLVAMAYRDEL